MCGIYLNVPHLIHVVDSLTLNSQPTALQPTSKQSLSSMSFLCKAPSSFHMLRRTWKNFSTMLGCHLTHWNHYQMVQRCKKDGTKQTENRTLVHRVRVETEGRMSGSTLPGNVCNEKRNFSPLSTCPETLALQVLIWGWQVKFTRSSDLQMWTPQTMRINCVFYKTEFKPNHDRDAGSSKRAAWAVIKAEAVKL